MTPHVTLPVHARMRSDNPATLLTGAGKQGAQACGYAASLGVHDS